MPALCKTVYGLCCVRPETFGCLALCRCSGACLCGLHAMGSFFKTHPTSGYTGLAAALPSFALLCTSGRGVVPRRRAELPYPAHQGHWHSRGIAVGTRHSTCLAGKRRSGAFRNPGRLQRGCLLRSACRSDACLSRCCRCAMWHHRPCVAAAHSARTGFRDSSTVEAALTRILACSRDRPHLPTLCWQLRRTQSKQSR